MWIYLHHKGAVIDFVNKILCFRAPPQIPANLYCIKLTLEAVSELTIYKLLRSRVQRIEKVSIDYEIGFHGAPATELLELKNFDRFLLVKRIYHCCIRMPSHDTSFDSAQ